MAKLTLSDVSNLLGNPTSAQNTINNNSTLIEQALENTLSRNGTTPNQMGADLDMNNNDILNVDTLDTKRLILDGEEFRGLDPEDLEIIKDVSDAIKDGTLSNVVSQGNVPIYATVIGMPSVPVPSSINAIRVNGYYTAGDGGGALYVKVDDEPVHAGKFQTMDGAWWEICEENPHVKQFGAVYNDPNGDQTAAIQAAINFAENKRLCMGGIYYLNGGTLTIPHTMQLWWPTDIAFYNRLVFKGTGVKQVLTTRKHPDDGLDDPISAAIIVTGQHVVFDNPFLDLYCDYTDTERTNWGDDYDVALFIKSVPNCRINNPRTRGYWREAAIWGDCTGPSGILDGLRINDGRLQGFISFVLRGALPKSGNTGILIGDNRGSGGYSDVLVELTNLEGWNHHSKSRRSDTEGGCLEIEGYLYPGASAVDSPQGQVFRQVRFGDVGPKTINIQKGRRISFERCFVDRPSGFTKADGVTGISNNDCQIIMGAGAKHVRVVDTDIYRTALSIASGAIVDIEGGVNEYGNPTELPWTPAVAGIVATYNSRAGRYTRKAGRVFIQGQMNFATFNTGSASGFNIAGLPFNIRAGTAVELEIDYRLSTLLNLAVGDVIHGVPHPSVANAVSFYFPNRSALLANSGKINASGVFNFTGAYYGEVETP